ncbi:hypothetical protein EJ08DRAFT_645844 [Tothia fuscella]|uniref:Uncharacterized protein n=1 Tax=Tothia fuscella TaxID=1048955 RepID=A0A9P4P1I6_9PEZI|nr:hypothetical protein EJ08DRAFT_645844 [Tothia fuscella]
METDTITSLFQTQPSPIARKDSGIADVTSQLNSFEGFSDEAEADKEVSPSTPSTPITITFTPSQGSTCLSLYPRTKSFTYTSKISPSACLASTPDHQEWRITSSVDRFTFERLNGEGETVETFKNCAVRIGSPVLRRGSSADYGRRLSIGHFSFGISGMRLPSSPSW